MKAKLNVSAGLLLVTLATSASAGVIVVAKDSPLQAFESEQARRVFLGQQPFVSGHTVTVVYQKEGEIRTTFEEKVVGETGTNLSSLWFRQIFSGRSRPLVEVSNDSDVKARISSTVGAIGFISDNAFDGSVKALYRY